MCITCLAPRGQESDAHVGKITRTHPKLVQQLFLLLYLFVVFLFVCLFWGCFFLPLREMQELPGKGDQESAVRRLPWVILQSAGRPGTKHGPDCVLLFFTQVNFLQSLHGHRSILLYHDNKTGPAPLDGSFCVASGVAGVKHWVTFTGATQEVCSRKQKVPEQPLRFCFLCGLYWCLLLAYILIYLGGGD